MRPDGHHFEAMGTTCSVFASDRWLEAETWVRRVAGLLTRFSDDSEISQLNACAGEWSRVSDETERVLRASLRAYELSMGLVNVAVLPSMLAIGYSRPLAEGPAVAVLDRARPLPPLPDVLDVRAGRARVARGAAVDLGGIAKGWMADRLCEMLGPHSLANLGGDLRAAGEWPVAFGGVTLLLRDQGAATSSVRRRRWGALHHLIDPRTGLPADSDLAEVSVVAATGFEAEVLAKTALLLGGESAPAFCAAHALAWWFGARG
ncbi:MAG TPA: FAD:protein FMN transferase [Candidatus Dormibacteraeota bacterium]|nr:FAD:protein FMN transferase [Candidatus Dormibacteraeota bacterium]